MISLSVRRYLARNHMWLAAALGVLVLGSVASTPASAVDVVVDGFVMSTTGGPVVNADLDWFNRDLGVSVDPTGDHTNASGYFNVLIPEGRYDVTVIGPPSNSFAPAFLENLDLRSSQTLPTTLLPPGALVTASVENGAGQPLDAMQFTIEDSSTGDPVFIVNDRSDPFGAFSAVVPFGTWDVIVTDSSGFHAPDWTPDVTVSVPMALGTFVMNQGHVVTGRVVDSGNGGIFNVDIDVEDEVTGERLYTPGDNTDFFGNWSVFIPVGDYEFRFTPSPGAPFAPERRRHVPISGPGAIATVTLLPGLTVSGTVRNQSGLPLPGSDIDVIDVVTGEERYTPGDDTNATGTFTVTIPAGTFDFHFSPPAGQELAAGAMWDVAISSATTLPPVQLVPGVLVTGTVTGNGLGVQGVDLDFVVTSSGKLYPTPGDDTDVVGHYRVRVLPGQYDVTATPPPASGFGPTTQAGQMLLTDTTLNFVLDPLVGVEAATVTGPAGRILATPNPFRTGVTLDLSLEDGRERGPAVVSIHDATGRLVRQLVVRPAMGDAGVSMTWDGLDAAGRSVPPGVYFARLSGDHARAVTRVVRVR